MRHLAPPEDDRNTPEFNSRTSRKTEESHKSKRSSSSHHRKKSIPMTHESEVSSARPSRNSTLLQQHRHLSGEGLSWGDRSIASDRAITPVKGMNCRREPSSKDEYRRGRISHEENNSVNIRLQGAYAPRRETSQAHMRGRQLPGYFEEGEHFPFTDGPHWTTFAIGSYRAVISAEQDTWIEKVLDAQPFKRWVDTISKARNVKVSRLHVQSLDMFGKNVDFIKFVVESVMEGFKEPRNCTVFMRGGSVAILVILHHQHEMYSLIVRQPRVAVSCGNIVEIPAGMIDDDGCFAGVAAKEMKEEIGIEIKESDLVDMTGLSCNDEYPGMFSSCGATDEFLRLFLFQKNVSADELRSLHGKLTGVAEEGKMIKLQVIPLETLWRITPDAKTLSALLLYSKLRDAGHLPPVCNIDDGDASTASLDVLRNDFHKDALRDIRLVAVGLHNTLYPPGMGNASIRPLKHAKEEFDENIKAFMEFMFQKKLGLALPVTGNSPAVAQKKFDRSTVAWQVEKNPGIFFNGALVLGVGGVVEYSAPIETAALARIRNWLAARETGFFEFERRSYAFAVNCLTKERILWLGPYAGESRDIAEAWASTHLMKNERVPFDYDWEESPAYQVNILLHTQGDLRQMQPTLTADRINSIQSALLSDLEVSMGNLDHQGYQAKHVLQPWCETNIVLRSVNTGQSLNRLIHCKSVIDAIGRVSVGQHVMVAGDSEKDLSMFLEWSQVDQFNGEQLKKTERPLIRAIMPDSHDKVLAHESNIRNKVQDVLNAILSVVCKDVGIPAQLTVTRSEQLLEHASGTTKDEVVSMQDKASNNSAELLEHTSSMTAEAIVPDQERLLECTGSIAKDSTYRQRVTCILVVNFVILVFSCSLMMVRAKRESFDAPVCIMQEGHKPKLCEPCGSGTLVLPLGGEYEQSMSRAFRACVYFMALIWSFVGIAIVCDKFMAAIERITAQTVDVMIRGKRSARRIWNPTLANLTLMALGSSAPEILLSSIELVRNEFFAGELGPSTIVGSAAFNLLVISAVCIVAIPPGETKKIANLEVFAVTATTSMCAYGWLVVILRFNTPDMVDCWEAVATFAMFPVMLVTAYAADKGWLASAPGIKEHGRGDRTNIDCETLEINPTLIDLESRAAKAALDQGDIVDLKESARASGKYFPRGSFGEVIEVGSEQVQVKLKGAVAIWLPLNMVTLNIVETFNHGRPSTAKLNACEQGAPDSSLCVSEHSKELPEGSTWADEVREALYCKGSLDEQSEAGYLDWLFHVLTLPWKILFVLVPPPCLCGGWACFCISLAMIGAVTALVGDMADLLGCCIGIPGDITAITLVALGTSVPDTFASKMAAQQEETADNAIGNVTGSNAVNVFLGLGLPWTIGAFYWKSNGLTEKWLSRDHRGRSYQEWTLEYASGGFLVPAGSLTASVTIFTGVGLACLLLFAYRRIRFGGELGGPKTAQVRDACFLVFLWFVYIAGSVTNSLMMG